MTISDSRVRTYLGALMLVVGAGLVAINYRALSTYLLDVVVQMIGASPSQSLAPYDFSWGTMHWGRTPTEFTSLCVGLLLIAVGQALAIPVAIQRIRSVASDSRRSFLKRAMALAFVLTLVAAGCFALIPIITKNAFGSLAIAGAADPMALAESLPVRSSQFFMVCLVAAQLVLAAAALSLPKSVVANAAPGGKAASIAACACMLLFVMFMAITRLGPVRFFEDVTTSSMGVNPVDVAGQIILAHNIMLAAAPLLAAAAVLYLVAIFAPIKHGN